MPDIYLYAGEVVPSNIRTTDPTVIKLATLYCASSRIRELFSGNNSPTEDGVNTPAGTHDSSDATYDGAWDGGDGDSLDPLIDYAVDYVMDTAAVSGTISYVRVQMRERRWSMGGLTASIRPYVGGLDQGTPVTTILDGSTYKDRWWYLYTDSGGARWTNDSFNAKRWGFHGNAFHLGDFFDETHVDVSEYIIELWGLSSAFPAQFSGLRTFYNALIRELCLVAEVDAPSGMGGVIKVQKGGVKYAVYLVDVTDTNASSVRVKTSTGVKAVRLKT